jgi:hypothetical protein
MVEWAAVVRNWLPAVTAMHPTLVREPFHRDGWAYEEKYDGWQIVYRHTGRSRIILSARRRRIQSRTH